MFEVLKIIVLACQVSGGGERAPMGYIYENIDDYQKKCQKELIKCVVFKGDTSETEYDRLVQCLYKR